MECNLVIGARGVGKSFWTAALRARTLRTLLGQLVRELERTDVRIGFSVAPLLDAYPDSDVFRALIKQYAAYDIWRAVIARWLAEITPATLPCDTWEKTVGWVSKHPEAMAKMAQDANMRLEAEQRYGLIVFDALDRTSNDWRTIDFIKV